MKPIGIIDYHLGNLGSILNMFKYLGIDAEVITLAHKCADFDKIILPGVGHFKAGMNNLKKMGFDGALRDFISDRYKGLLGICVGMQLLFEESEEGEGIKGLGFLKGTCVRFPDLNEMPVPHMGWNYVYENEGNPLLEMPFDEKRFYFAHSYFVEETEENMNVSKTRYGRAFTSALVKDNIYAVQFHPEKSHKFGLALLNNFAKLSLCLDSE